jgi:alpha-beta hydrolase superfamily lysophospholipase
VYIAGGQLSAKRIFVISLLVQLLIGCAHPYLSKPAPFSSAQPLLQATHAVMQDGYRLPLSIWRATGEPRAILLALHGLNEHRQAFDSSGAYLAKRGITLLAYDQRGFGETEGRGYWHGVERLTGDLHTLIDLLHQRYPQLPLYLLGESMGGAVVLAALHSAPLDVDGVILLAPAVWSRDRMPWYQRFALWLTAHTMPMLKLSAEGVDIHPSDNLEMLRAWGRDPLVIKQTRADVLYGLSNLMDRAVDAAGDLDGKALILYGRHDDIVPLQPVCLWLRSLPKVAAGRRTVLIYRDGYHMLTRDLQGHRVLEDMADWIVSADGPIQQRGYTLDLDQFCSDTWNMMTSETSD